MNDKVINFLKENGYEISGERSMKKFLPIDYMVWKKSSVKFFDENKAMKIIMNQPNDTKKHIYFGIEDEDESYFCTIIYPLECDYRNTFYVNSYSFKKLLVESYWEATQRASGFYRNGYFKESEEYVIIVTELETLIEKLMIDLDK